MAELDVKRLTIRAPGLSTTEGQRLADHVTRHLADAPSPAGVKRRPDADRAEIRVQAITDLDALAKRIAAEILRQIG